MKRYLLSEIDEFLDADDPAARHDEFGDVLFALKAMAWAHTGQHFALDLKASESKIRQRLRDYASLSRRPRRYLDDRIPEMPIGVLHFAFGHFGGQWQRFDALQSGTVAEISLLTDAPFGRPDRFTNHCIVTFGGNDELQYDIIHSHFEKDSGNTIRCCIPDFMFQTAKKELKFKEYGELLALQVLSAIEGLRFSPGAIAHFHSWESGFLTDSEEIRSRLESFKTFFSPYLTTGRLKSLVENRGGGGWTMSPEELAVSTTYERKLSTACMRVVLESARDRDFYANWIHPDRIDIRSFARDQSSAYPSDPPDPRRLTFIAGGRPVREKGFVELCRQFSEVRRWADEAGVEVSLVILCRDPRRDKGAAYIQEIQDTIAALGLDDVVRIEAKVSLEQLLQRISGTSAVIVPSIYDPFCLMPTYAVETHRPAFVSCHAGVSENIRSRQFTFDPQIEGDLARAVAAWHADRPAFEYEARFPSYRDLYLAQEALQPWE